MNRRAVRSLLAPGLVVLLLGLLAGPAWGQTQEQVLIRSVDAKSFPTMSLTVSLANAATLSPGDVQVTENGKTVQNVALKSLSTSSEGVDVVLVLDTSNSMIGDPLASAVAAAKEFINGSPPQLRIGLITFNRSVKIQQDLSTDRAPELSALDSLTTAPATHLYDAVVAAAKLFSGPAQRNIVLLTDGNDTGSALTLSAANKAAQRAQATIFAIGLGPLADVKVLTSLAKATHGRYSPAETADLASIYKNLVKEIGNQYLISYRSTSAGGANVSIRVTVAGSSDTSLVLTPARPLPPPSPQPAPPPAKQLALTGGLGFALALVLCFLAAFAVMLLVLGPAARARRDRELAKRLVAQPGADFDSAVRHVDPAHVVAALAPTLAEAGKRLAEASGAQASLEVKLEQAGAPVTPGEFLAASVVGALLGAIVGGVLIGGWLFALLFTVVGAGLPTIILSVATQRRMKRLHAQLPDILMVLASSIRAGHSFMQALDTVSKEIGDPGAKEFARVLAEIRLGRSVDEAMNAMAERIDSDDFKWAVLAVNIQREVGGNLAEILDTVAETVRDRETIRRQIGVLSAEGKLSMYILIALPVFIGLYLYKINPDYISLLFSTTSGLIMFIGSICLLVLGVIWMRKIVKIDV